MKRRVWAWAGTGILVLTGCGGSPDLSAPTTTITPPDAYWSTDWSYELSGCRIFLPDDPLEYGRFSYASVVVTNESTSKPLPKWLEVVVIVRRRPFPGFKEDYGTRLTLRSSEWVPPGGSIEIDDSENSISEREKRSSRSADCEIVEASLPRVTPPLDNP